MFSQFSRSKKEAQSADEIDSIKNMLDSTWDLSAQFRVRPESRHYEGVALFNGFFSRLNHIVITILKNVVKLSALAPDLFSFSRDFKKKAEEQALKIAGIVKAGQAMADQIETIAENSKSAAKDSEEIQKEVQAAKSKGESSMDRFAEIKLHVQELAETIRVLDENSKSIGSIIDVINNIADETNILSLNAQIEASRHTVEGKGFKVIAEEVAALARQSKDATRDIQARLDVLRGKVDETVAAVEKVEENVASGEELITDANQSLQNVHERFKLLIKNMSEVETSTMLQAKDVKSVSQDIVYIEDVVKEQTKGVETIFQIAEEVNTTCKEMIMDTGIFHLTSHHKAKTDIETFSHNPGLVDAAKETKERTLAEYLKIHPHIELAYVTDENGRQTTDNIYSAAIEHREEFKNEFGKNWSDKEWYKKTAGSKQIFVSKVYQSSATNQFCFTIAVPLFKSDDFCGVLGIDINFKDILEI